ncbi:MULTISPECIES: type II toxin-antitoxin system RelE/ParE family toxin [Marinicauda]|uniref:type II toxin-antitoxin system RelE/ParE family toxin n=1 Tax=Marinicauda TaxID=1649466 RepID=UPI0022E834B3|nr:type II toxin-antitoxin system RelE/ParE family toxin [Marinicauda sp. Alg238-R41]
MKRYSVVFEVAARRDLRNLHDWIARKSGVRVAMGFMERIRSYCEGFEIAPERGRQCPDIRPGLRLVGFERCVTIAFTVNGDRVVILRIIYRGRDLERLLG